MRFLRLQVISLALAVGFVLLTQPMIGHSQETTSGMTGTVTDQSGAAVPNAKVTLSNPTTGVKFEVTANGTGFYRFSDIPPGQGYIATFSAPGFASVQVKDIYLTVSNIRTQNAALNVGQQVSTVEVTASNSEVTIDTTTPEIGNTFDVKQLNNLPVQDRSNPSALFSMQPGVSDEGAVTGARVDQNYVTLDGLDVNDISTGGAVQNNTGAGVEEGFSSGTIIGHAPVDSVEEFKGSVAGEGADTGAASGGQFQLVTKSGTNQFHGNINEYHRDPSLVANAWFNNNSNPIVPRNHLIQNQFGGAVGGPVLRNRLFFFFDYNDDRIISEVSEERVVPLPSMLAGQIGYPTTAGNNCYLNPTTTTQCNGTTHPSVQSFDPSGVGEDNTFLTGVNGKNGFTGLTGLARFPAPNNTAAGDGINTGGLAFNAPDSDFSTNYVARIDYNLNQNMKIFGRFTISRENAVEYPNEFPGDPETDPFLDKSYAFVIGHTWVIGSNKTNKVFLGETVAKQSFPNTFNADGSTFFTFGDGADSAPVPSSLYLQPASSARRVPIPMVGDDFAWTRGAHTWMFGGTFKNILAHDTTVGDYNTTEIGLGGEIFALCGPNPGDCGGTNPSLRPSDIDTSNANSATWDQNFATLLGRIGDVASDFNFNAQGTALTQLTGDQRYYRYYQTQLYLQDSWKALPSLTISYGLTYQYFSVPYETRGLESVDNISFDEYMNARVIQSNSGLTGPFAVPLISYSLGGKGNGSNAPPLYQPEWRNIAPHVGFSWNPDFDKKSVLNGGFSVVYDRTVINAIQHLQDSYSYLFQQTKTVSDGISGDSYDSIKNDPRLNSSNNIFAVTPPPTPRPPYQPFTNGGVPYGLQNGGAFNETIDPTLKTPYSLLYNIGIQRQMPGDFVVKASYVGRLGRKLISQADANQVLEFPDPVSGELYSTAFAALTTAARAGVPTASVPTQPWFENVLEPGLGASYGFANNTQYLYASTGHEPVNGDFGDFTQALSNIQDNNTGAYATPANVGMGAQFSENSFHGNKGFSAYNGLLASLQKNLSHGVQFDLNYTWSHSIDNVSLFASGQGDTGIGGGGLICDDIRPRECRASSDFDLRQIISGDATYLLPFGTGKMFLGTATHAVNEAIGGWAISGVLSRHTGYPWQTASNAYVASYSNDSPARLVGSASIAAEKLTKLPGGGVTMFPNPNAAAQFTGPIGFTIGPRNSERGPGYFNMDLGLAKDFPIVTERIVLKFRTDAFNALNHPNFALPAENVYNGYDQEDYENTTNFGHISFQANPENNLNNGARVLQLSLRMEF